MTTATPSLNAASAGSSRLLGTALVILSTIAIAIVPSFARLAYDGGSNTLIVITARSILTVLLTFVVALLCRQSLRIARKPMLLCVAAGVCYAIMLYGFLGAVAYIPVNTVILIYFVHPVIVGLVATRLGEEALSKTMILALLTALGGLALAVGASFGQMHLTGIALAALAMVTCVLVILSSGRAAKQAGGLVVVFYMMLSAALTLSVLFAFFGEFALPATEVGWLGFGGVAIGSTIGTLAFFCAVPMIGAVRATMISNLEPLLGIGFAVALLGETITGFQMAGIAMVLTSIMAMELKR